MKILKNIGLILFGVLVSFSITTYINIQNINKIEKNHLLKIYDIEKSSFDDLKDFKEKEKNLLDKIKKEKDNTKIQANKATILNTQLLKNKNNIQLYKKQQIDNFINERKVDILFLSRITLRQKIINSFYHTNKFDDKNIYKEVVFFNLKGKEIYKKSVIEVLKMDISKKKNTYCQKETYFDEIKNLQEGQIFVSKIVTSKENKAIIRIITPIVRKFKKVGFLSVALDYEHINKIKNIITFSGK